MDEEKRNSIITTVLSFIALFMLIFVNSRISSYAQAPAEVNQEHIITQSEKAIDNSKDEFVFVHLCGNIKRPGVYRMRNGDMVINALQEAGGITKNGNPNGINLARKLKNGDKIEIPDIRDNKSEIKERYLKSNKENKNDLSININEANIQELSLIRGIGEKTAEKIIEYREENGRFESIDDLENIPGIRKKTINECRKYIKIE